MRTSNRDAIQREIDKLLRAREAAVLRLIERRPDRHAAAVRGLPARRIAVGASRTLGLLDGLPADGEFDLSTRRLRRPPPAPGDRRAARGAAHRRAVHAASSQPGPTFGVRIRANVQHEVELILLRQVASYLADADLPGRPGRQPRLLQRARRAAPGYRFDETGEMPIDEWSTVFVPRDDDGEPLPASDAAARAWRVGACATRPMARCGSTASTADPPHRP